MLVSYQCKRYRPEEIFPVVIRFNTIYKVHAKDSLASAFAKFFEKQSEEAPPGPLVRAVPSEEGICNVLRACEEQTSAFAWSDLLDAVALRISILRENMVDCIPATIFRGLLLMLPLVQRFPEEYEAMIQIDGSGLCALVVWMHHVLGMTVLVKALADKVRGGFPIEDVVFGDEEPQVTIEVGICYAYDEQITLFKCSSKEVLFQLKPDVDDDQITSCRTTSLKSYGKKQLEACWSSIGLDNDVRRIAVLQDLKHMVIALALQIGVHLDHSRRQPPGARIRSRSLAGLESPSSREKTPQPSMASHEREMNLADFYALEMTESSIKTHTFNLLKIDQSRILQAAGTLFDGEPDISEIQAFMSVLKHTPFNLIQPPQSSKVACKEVDCDFKKWTSEFSEMAGNLAMLLLALTEVVNLVEAEDIPLLVNMEAFGAHDIFSKLKVWNGKAHIIIDDNTWFHLLGCLLIGHRLGDKSELDQTSLVSDRGWSLFLSTCKQNGQKMVDPSFIGEKQTLRRWLNFLQSTCS